MDTTVCLNVVRHPAIPVLRGHETWEQFIDPAFNRANDDIDPVDGPAGVAAAILRLLLDRERPLRIRHSPTVRARKGADLFAEELSKVYGVEVKEDEALAELLYRRDRLWSREDHDRLSGIAWQERMQHFYRPILEDGAPAAPSGRRRILSNLASLRETLATGGLVNHLWVSHGLVMPFIYLGLVDQLSAEEWTLERALGVGRFAYAAGFHLRVPIRAPTPAP